MRLKLMAGIETHVLEDADEIETLTAAWRTLLARSNCNRAFSSPTWLLACLRAGPAIRPRVFVARRNTTVVGVLPLVVDTAVGRLCFPSELADYNDVIVEPGDQLAAVTLLASAMRRHPDYDQLALPGVRPDAELLPALTRLVPDLSATVDGNEDSTLCPYANLLDGYAPYLESRKQKFRAGLRRFERRAIANGIHVRELTPATFAPSELPNLFLDLHTNRIPGGIFQTKAARSFVEFALPPLFRERALRVFALHQGDAIVGVSLSMVGAGSLGNWNGGFNQEFACWAPGKLMLHAQIRDCCEEGIAEFDFMRGDEDYKRDWTTGSRTIGTFRLRTVAT